MRKTDPKVDIKHECFWCCVAIVCLVLGFLI